MANHKRQAMQRGKIKAYLQWANLLTAMRIPLSLFLPFLPPLKVAFLSVYAACCLTDMLDGPIARKTGTQSKFGARLDSAADAFLALMLVLAIYPVVKIPAGMGIWIAGIAVVRVLSGLTALIRFKTFTALHTYANKAVGLLLFLFPFCLALLPPLILGWILCTAATLSSLEEWAIQLTAKSLNLNRKSIFIKECI